MALKAFIGGNTVVVMLHNLPQGGDMRLMLPLAPIGALELSRPVYTA